MRRFRGLIESPFPPSTDMIWVYNHEMKYYSGGQWLSISNPTSITNVEGSEASVIAPVIRVGNTTEDKTNNIKVCSEYSTNDVVSVDIEGTLYGKHYDVVGVYHNGTVSILEGNHCTVFDIDFNDGTVTIDSRYDTSQLLPYTILEIGDSSVTASRNLEKLQAQTLTGVTANVFFLGVNYGYGVGTWNPTNGGQAHVVTAYGNTVYYTISAEGVVTKAVESPDLYLEYVNAGGKKTSTEFVQELIDLIG